MATAEATTAAASVPSAPRAPRAGVIFAIASAIALAFVAAGCAAAGERPPHAGTAPLADLIDERDALLRRIAALEAAVAAGASAPAQPVRIAYDAAVVSRSSAIRRDAVGAVSLELCLHITSLDVVTAQQGLFLVTRSCRTIDLAASAEPTVAIMRLLDHPRLHCWSGAIKNAEVPACWSLGESARSAVPAARPAAEPDAQ